MSYLVLARKFRPRQFESILGQEHITRALANAILREKVPHALLFAGPRGVGKTSAARVFAQALNCNGRPLPTERQDERASRKLIEPCGSCTNCQEIARSTSVAVWEVDGASNNSVDNIRELIESLRSLPPPGSRYKIYIIDEVHMLSTAAFNALLKSLEEPPPNTIFIFATTEPQRIPETVLSRCQRFDFWRISTQDIAAQLRAIAEGEGVSVDDQVFEFLARKAQGGMRDAQSLFDRLLAFTDKKIELDFAQSVFGVLDRRFFFELSQAVLKRDVQRCFTLLDQAFRETLDLKSFAADFITHWRNLNLLSHLSEAGAKNARELVRVLAVSEEELREFQTQVTLGAALHFQRLFDLAEKSAERMLQSNFPRYVLEAGIAKMAMLSELRRDAEVATRESAPKQQAKPSVPEVAPSTEPFNPSWVDFVHHVQSRSEVMLATFLKRVSAEHFSNGQLRIKARPFDSSTLKEPANLRALQETLASYSGVSPWNIQFVELTEEQSRAPSPTTSAVVSGSIVAQQEEAERERTLRIESEMRQDPVIKNVLSTFEGSKVEKVSVLKR